MNINFFKKIFGSRNERVIKRLLKTVNKINILDIKIRNKEGAAAASKRT